MLGDQGPPAHESLTTESCLVVAHADSCSDESSNCTPWTDDEDAGFVCGELHLNYEDIEDVTLW